MNFKIFFFYYKEIRLELLSKLLDLILKLRKGVILNDFINEKDLIEFIVKNRTKKNINQKYLKNKNKLIKQIFKKF